MSQEMRREDSNVIKHAVLSILLLIIAVGNAGSVQLKNGGNNTWAGHDIIYNNTAQGKIYLNSSFLWIAMTSNRPWVLFDNVNTNLTIRGFVQFENAANREFVVTRAGGPPTLTVDTSSGRLLVNDTIFAKDYKLSNGSVFDVIYGTRSTTGAILNNTAQGKIYLNASNGLFTTGNLTFLGKNPAMIFKPANRGIRNNITFLCDSNQYCNFTFENTANEDLFIIEIAPGSTTLDTTGSFFIRNNILPYLDNAFDLGGGQNAWKNISSRKYSLMNGSIFDVIYGTRSTTGAILNNTAQGKIYLNASNGVWLPWKVTIGNGSGTANGYLNITPTIIKLAQNTQFWLANSLLIRGVNGADGIGSLSVYEIIGNNALLLRSNYGSTGNIQLDASNGRILLNSSNAIIANETVTIKSTDDNTFGQLTLESTGVDGRLELYNSHGNNATGRASLLMSRTGGFQGLRFMIANTDYMILNWQGRLGLGTTAPKHLVDIRGNINSTGTLNISKIKSNSYTLSNGSTFDVIYGRDNNNQTLARGLVKNNTLQGKIYLNTTNGVYFSDGSNVIDNRFCTDITCNVGIENDSLGNLVFIRGGSVYISVLAASFRYHTNVRPATNNVLEIGNSSHKFTKLWIHRYINVTGDINTSRIKSRVYLLQNGSVFDEIYGSRGGGTTGILNNTLQGKIYLNSTLYTTRNISLIYPATALLFGNGSSPFYNHTLGCEGLARCGFKFLYTPNIDKWLLLSPAGLGTTTLDPTFLSSTQRIAFLTHIFPAENNLFDLGTTDSGGPLYWRNVSSYKFQLKNGSNFDALYGRTSLTATIQNNTAQGKVYLNASNGGLFVNSNITARRFYLTNGSNFDAIYGARGSGGGVSNNTFDLFTSLKINATRITAKYGTLSNNITIGNVGSFGMNITGRYINISNGGSIILNGKDIGTRRWTIQFVADANGAGFLCTNCPVAGTEFNPVVITNMTGVRAGRIVAFCDVACDVDTNISIIDGGNLPYFYVAGPNAAATAEAGAWTANSLSGDQSFNVMIKGGGAAQDDYRVTNIYLELMT